MDPPHGRKKRNQGVDLIILCAGAMIGSVLTQILSPGADWENCRRIGIELSNPVAPAAECNFTGPPKVSSLELLPTGPGDGREFRLSRANGTYNISTPFKGPTTASTDQAWQRYWRVWTFAVDEHAYHLSQPEHPEAGVQVTAGGGRRRYLATFAATHQLHCLYNLFRATYRDSYDEEQTEFERDPVAWHGRVDHCVDIIRQKLECDRDTTLVTYNWVKRKRDPVANFNVVRRCAVWDEMERWGAEHEVQAMPEKPEDAVQLDRIP
ncbi:hypothetical protein QBC34DRAFT_445047 [Podospora aff. communis PSN243]|uniref:Uncharacterized protein n=1 Tax=Podospora aff. communis PSN243 TaxID=3040156 RepID=A0AAV9H4P5_9PEZI|nr:hypothetical protein QBC34DRAFT_445047 [Podospora aff. communis PSN243]